MKPLSVLIVDDDRDFGQSLANLLRLEGHEVELAFDGEAAVENFLARDFDVAFLDVMLPVLSCLEVYLEMKKQGRTVPTVIVTGYAVEEADSIDALRAMSVTGCLVKPFGPVELAQALEEMPKGRER